MSKKIPRLEFEDLSASTQKILESRVKRLGYLGEFFKCSGHVPDVLDPFMQMTEGLKKALPDRLTEVGALTVATVMGNDYELHQHERLSRTLGFADGWIISVKKLKPDQSTELSHKERAVQRLIIAMLERSGKDVEPELEHCVDAIGPEQCIAVLFLVGRYVTHALVVNALNLSPPVQSIFGTQE